MPTLQDTTLSHSQRLSDIHRTRDADLAGALARRDAELRGLPSASRAFAMFDAEIAAAHERGSAVAERAQLARAATVAAAIHRRGQRLEDAEAARRSADAGAVDTRRRAEEAAERRFRDAMSSLTATTPLAIRQKTTLEAERARSLEIEQAKRAHTEALTSAQAQHRTAVDEAILAESRDSREADRDLQEALAQSDLAVKAARATAERTLAASLDEIDPARDVLAASRRELAGIAEQAKRAEADEFERFRRELGEITRPPP